MYQDKEDKDLTAKEYLREIRILDKRIDQKQREFDTLKRGRTYVGGMDYSQERVQTSAGQGFVGLSDKLVDMQREINRDIDQFNDIRHARINQIQQLSRIDYMDILFRRYVQYQSFEEISSDMEMSYYWTCHLHGEALKEFSEKFLKDSN
ncbi:hypothetical protein CLOSTASPAR_05032 [[Clostridium] asparagiforme DSM 15981]|jgi:hypothetical protein|uniref:Phage transcriptional regulator, RinA family n=1 Tax=[Clostridium] asparagiforme DSM 15981 TaxID=518636 RepID=C0D6Y5_9FIRM|nr:hypothetical protein CLOSTASPAR_05032 [[Clostridium] asparagiforme DSM 15981]DAW88996.1 MAG TPA: Protein of unknown function (DUF1492) [Bacteriophage sp.]